MSVISDQARNLRIIAREKGIVRENLPNKSANNYSRKSIHILIIFLLSLFFLFNYLYQNKMLRTMEEKNRIMEKKIDLLNYQLDSVRSELNFTVRDNHSLKEAFYNLYLKNKEESNEKTIDIQPIKEALTYLSTNVESIRSKVEALEYARVKERELLNEDMEHILKSLDDKINLVVSKVEVMSKRSATQDNPNLDYMGEVIFFNKDYNFIVVNIGKKDSVREGDIFGVYRNNQRIALVKVLQLLDNVSACDIESSILPINVGDKIRKL
ncbi:MAG: hypothetical protein NC820_07495 [Candidatus Omnitrophica bacterium]|nr:hypothetical protein [Candidatus Omnitrophota bacterium]